MTVNAQKSPSQGLMLLSILNPAVITEEDAMKGPQRLEVAEGLVRDESATTAGKKKAITVATIEAVDKFIFFTTLGIVNYLNESQTNIRFFVVQFLKFKFNSRTDIILLTDIITMTR